MSREVINIGSTPNDGTGDPIRNAFAKVNSNFTELYDRVDEIEIEGTEWNEISGKPSFSTVAVSGSYDDLTNKPTLGSVAEKDGFAVPNGGTSGQVLSKSSNADGALEWVDQSGGGGGGSGIEHVVQDTSPQLGGSLDLNGFDVGGASTADLTKLNEITATSTEINYTTGLAGNVQTQLDGKVAESDYDANSLLVANTDNTPTPLVVEEDRLIGRLTGGNITGLTGGQIRTLINVEDGATADQTNEEIRDSLETLVGENRLSYSGIDGLDSIAAGGLYQTAIISAGSLEPNHWLRINLAGTGFVAVSGDPSSVPIPDEWIIVNGKSGTTYGYQEVLYGAIYNPIVAEERTIESLATISPNVVRLRITGLGGEYSTIPGIDSVEAVFRDTSGNTSSAILFWNEDTTQYETSNAATTYSWLAAREKETLTVTGLNTEYVVSTLTVIGDVPTTMEVGEVITVGIDAVGGVAPYTYALTGSWPAGISIDSSTGVISGSPTTPGSYTNLSVQVTDSASVEADLPELTITVSAAPALDLTGTPVTTATQGTAYTGFTVTASGGVTPYSYSLVGTWPAGISINTTTGVISGIPGNSGSFTNLSARVTDSLGNSDDLATFTLTVSAGSEFGEFVSYTSGNGTDPSLPTHEVGDWFVAVVVRTASHSGGTVLPTVVANVDNPWTLWDSLYQGTDRSIAVYTLQCTDIDHTFTTTNTGGTRRAIWQYRGKEPDVIKLATYNSSANVTFPEL